MASNGLVGFPIPPPLSLSEPDSLTATWKTWQRQWKNYSIATGLKEKPEEVQAATLLTCLGPEALNVLDGLCPDEDEQKKVDVVLEKFEEFCIGKTNETFERYKFNLRNQEGGESIDLYVAELRKLAKSCNYQNLEESLIRDRVVLGVPDEPVRRRLLQEPDLTLAKATTIVKAHEATQKQMSSMASREDSTINKIHVKRKENRNEDERYTATDSRRTHRAPNIRYGRCKFCGREHEFKKELCPAWGHNCQACGRKNHFASRCRHAEIRLVEPVSVSDVRGGDETNHGDENSVLSLDIGALSDNSVSDKVFAHLLLGGDHLQKFQLDTGATANIIPLHVYKKTCNDPKLKKLKPSATSLVMFNKSTTKPAGKATINVMNPKTGLSYSVEFLVVREDFSSLLGSKTVQQMDLIQIKEENIASVKTDETDNVLRSEEEIRTGFTDVFTGVGKLPGKLHIHIDESAPPVQLPTRSVPEALKKEVRAELDRMERDGIITPVTEPSEWISGMVAVRKPSKGIRICIDPKPLNRVIKRNHFPLPTIEDILPELAEAKVFTVCDAKSGYWHVELDEASSFLTTFGSPWGRYRWRRLPFGLCLASEEFQRRLNVALEGLDGVRPIADDILVYGIGRTYDEAVKDHDRKLICLLNRCREVGLRLNFEKMKLRKAEVKYMGHMFTAEGLKADPEKISAVMNMPAPTDRKGVQRVLGLVNYLQRFSPRLADASAPLRALLKKENMFIYEENVHGRALAEIKKIITRDPVLKYYNVNDDVVVQVDASHHGLGACLMQNGQPVAYASRSLTETERNYAQIEKEMLAIVYGLNKFERYTLGKQVTVESDHKPLEAILEKELTRAPKRLQRMMLSLQKYQFKVMYKRGQDMYLADTLSRAHETTDPSEYRRESTEQVCHIHEEASTDEVEVRNVDITEGLPVSKVTMDLVKEATLKDNTLQNVQKMIKEGWPSGKNLVPGHLRQYYSFKDELSLKDGLIFRGERLCIPEAARAKLKERVHASHIGLQGCIRRAREAIFWPGMNQELESFISKCSICMAHGNKQRETLASHEVPDRPWQNVSCDLMDFQGHAYLVTVDAYSDFIEVDRLISKKANDIVRLLKMQMARHGIPDKLMTDNGPPFSSAEFSTFSQLYEFRHITSSPGYPQSNGKAESAVKILKSLMLKAQDDGRDPYLALLDWRNTPTEGIGSSPAQRLFGRRTKTLLPTTARLLRPETVRDVPSKLIERQQKQAVYYNRGARDLKPVKVGDNVYVAPEPCLRHLCLAVSTVSWCPDG